ncbi:MAG TPA: DUF6650 family protein [Thermoleophilaceae bacterium]|nr:DUF6650 family protein [Thermoleophilaceae bacterium]
MKFSALLSRVNGFSTPVFGMSWEPARSDVEVAQGLLLFLEDRRVLYSPYEVEVPEHCVESVQEIRRFLTDVLVKGGIADELAEPLSAMRASCRKFLDEVNKDRVLRERWQLTDMMGVQGWTFNQALGQLRGVVGVHVAQVAVRYGLDVPDVLDPILPTVDSD